MQQSARSRPPARPGPDTDTISVRVYRGPLDPPGPDYDYPTALRGGIVTDPDEIRAIRRRVEAGVRVDARRAAWRRVLRRIRAGR